MLVFIDESGYPRPTDATDNPVLLAVCLHENDIKSITNQIYKLKDYIYGKQDEIKSTKLIREATITKNRTKNRADRKITEAFTSFLFKTNFGRSFEHILEMPLFVSSAVTPSIQFADIFAGIIRHYYENHLDTEEPTTEYQKWLVYLFKKLQCHIKNTPIPDSKYTEFALQKIGTHYTYNVNMNATLPFRIKEDFFYFT